MGLRSSPLAYTILPSSAGGLGLFQSQGRKEMQMKTEELDIIRDAVHNALEAVRCLGGLEKKSSMILISKNDLKTYLGGNLEGKLVEAYKILEAEASTES